MWKRLSTGLSEANQWAQKSDGPEVAQALRDLAFALTKLLLALTYFLIALADILVGRVENVVNRGRGAATEKREKKLKTHLNWDRADDENHPTGALRR